MLFQVRIIFLIIVYVVQDSITSKQQPLAITHNGSINR
jgi:hypothetical protein